MTMPPTLYIWLLTQDQNRGYDTYDSCVVIAPDEEFARKIHPASWFADAEWWCSRTVSDTWATHPDNVTAECVGVALDGAMPGTIVCASFNAG